MSTFRTEREAWRAFWVYLLTPVVVLLSLVLAYYAQGPFRGPVFIDLGGFPGLVSNDKSIGVGVLVYGLSISPFLLAAGRLAPGGPFATGVLGATLGAMVLPLVVG